MGSKNGLFLLLAGVTLLLMVMIGMSTVDQLGCEGQLSNENISPTLEQQIYGERLIGQSFIAPRNDLNRIDIFFQTYQRQNTHDVFLRLLEFNPEIDNPLQGVELFTMTINAALLQDQSWRTFTFSPIHDSEQKRYLFVLQSPNSENGNAITVGGVQQDVYAPGQAFLGPVPAQADIAFRTCYQITTTEKFQILFRRLTQSRPGVWYNVGFYVLGIVFYLLLAIGLVWRLIVFGQAGSKNSE